MARTLSIDELSMLPNGTAPVNVAALLARAVLGGTAHWSPGEDGAGKQRRSIHKLDKIG